MDQRVVEPGKGLVGQVAAAAAGAAGDDTVLMTNNPSEEKGYLAEVDMPRPAGEGSDAAEDG